MCLNEYLKIKCIHVYSVIFTIVVARRAHIQFAKLTNNSQCNSNARNLEKLSEAIRL